MRGEGDDLSKPHAWQRIGKPPQDAQNLRPAHFANCVCAAHGNGLPAVANCVIIASAKEPVLIRKIRPLPVKRSGGWASPIRN
jgi:hypothetical protein